VAGVALVSGAAAPLGPVDLLVDDAGVAIAGGLAEQTAEESAAVVETPFRSGLDIESLALRG